MIGICGGIRPEWAYTDFACALFGLTSVPVHTKAGAHITAFFLSLTRCDQMTTRPSSS